MQLEQHNWSEARGWLPHEPGKLGGAAQLVLVFASTSSLDSTPFLDDLAAAYPEAAIIVCSTAGEISGTRVTDDSVVATAMALEHSSIRTASLGVDEVRDSQEAGQLLARRLGDDDLAHLLVLSDGTHVNGSSLVDGIVESLPHTIPVTGGLAGDGERFDRTYVFRGTEVRQELVVGVGFYGDRLRIGHGSLGGWDPFGPERLITRSKENVLYELDGRSALGLYRKYLGDYASDLPASALLFPLVVRSPAGRDGIVRTVLAINDEALTMTFAGDLPEGHYARLMKANFERLIDGATLAARVTCDSIGGARPEFALLISCVGRKMVLRQRIEEEVESVREIFGDDTVMAGFYSYGEISPLATTGRCELHNQTMTITTFSES